MIIWVLGLTTKLLVAGVQQWPTVLMELGNKMIFTFLMSWLCFVSS